MIYIGSKGISKLYLGGKAVASAWIGSKKVYPSGSPITDNVIEGTIIYNPTGNPFNISVTFNYVNADNTGTTIDMTTDKGNFYLTEYDGALTSLKNAFYNRYMMTSLTKFDLDTSNVTTMSYMFHGCNANNLSIIDVSLMNTSNVTDMSYMFDYCSHAKELKFNLNTSKVTNMTYMFNNCGDITSLDLSNFDTSKVQYFNSMFGGCNSLLTLDLSSFDLSSLSYAFDNYTFDCPSVTDFRVSSKFFNASDNITKYDFSKLTNWTESLGIFVDALPQLTSTKTVKLSDNTKNALTDNQKTVISDKGWTIA